jgi:small-conductance mechanosensitive channel
MKTLNYFLEFEILHIGDSTLKVYSILTILFIFLITKLILWLINKTLNQKNKFNTLDPGNAYALFQIIRYVFWIIAIALILETIGVQVTVLIAGSAALLVGVGLGLQQTFNNFISGIILLVEGATKAGDVLEIDGDVVIIQEIGLRTSKGLNRDQIVNIIPNSLITENKVINWSNQSKKTRFGIDVGVAYGSDVEQVTKTLEESVAEHPEIKDKKIIEARLLDFGGSSLDFRVLFFSEDIFRIEKVKSDIRKIINRKFNENNITIPFPQMDMHLISKTYEGNKLTGEDNN